MSIRNPMSSHPREVKSTVLGEEAGVEVLKCRIWDVRVASVFTCLEKVSVGHSRVRRAVVSERTLTTHAEGVLNGLGGIAGHLGG